MCGFFFVFSYINYLESTEKESIVALANGMADNLTPILEFAEINYTTYSRDAQEILDGFKYNSKVDVATLYTAGGMLYANYHAKEYAYIGFPEQIKENVIKQQKDNNWLVYYRIVEKSADTNVQKTADQPPNAKPLGYLCLNVQSSKKQLVIHIISTSIYVLIVAFLLAIILWQFANRSIQIPINNLIEFIKKIEHNKDYSQRLLPEKDKELNELVSVFNEMLAEVYRRDQSLLAMQNQLEQRVSERTQQLSEKTQSLEASNRELEHFAYVASHDLQEPLRMIASFSQLVEKKYKNSIDEGTKEYIFYITDGVKRMQTLIRDLLVYSRVGTAHMQIKSVNLDNLLLKVLSNLRIAIQESGATIKHQPDPLPIIEADETQTIQLFQNLIGNGIKFQQKKHRPIIKISVTDNDDHWLFSVSDNGIGIDPVYQERVFMIFQRLDRNYVGTGIGLAVCKKVVERHKGTIWFESGTNEGTVFYFTYPKKISTSNEEMTTSP